MAPDVRDEKPVLGGVPGFLPLWLALIFGPIPFLLPLAPFLISGHLHNRYVLRFATPGFAFSTWDTPSGPKWAAEINPILAWVLFVLLVWSVAAYCRVRIFRRKNNQRSNAKAFEVITPR